MELPACPVETPLMLLGDKRITVTASFTHEKANAARDPLAAFVCHAPPNRTGQRKETGCSCT